MPKVSEFFNLAAFSDKLTPKHGPSVKFSLELASWDGSERSVSCVHWQPIGQCSRRFGLHGLTTWE